MPFILPDDTYPSTSPPMLVELPITSNREIKLEQYSSGRDDLPSTMSTSRESNHGPQPSDGASGPKPLSCVACRQRKVKCNKANPCNHCTKADIQCVFPNRVRVSRAKQTGSKTRDVELLKRISRLESLVSKIDAADATKDSHEENRSTLRRLSDTTNLTSTSADASNSDGQGRIDEKYAAFVKQQETATPYLSGEFWTNLCDEVDGLRHLLEHSVDDDDELDDSTSNSTEAKHSSPHFVFNNPGSPFESLPLYPSDSHRAILFQFYFANVDPICKILHKPNTISHLMGAKDLLDESTGRFKFRSIEAITFAIYFAAVTAMSPEECLNYFSEEKDALVTRYKRSTEAALTQADLMNSMEIVTLQALTLYMMTLRSHDKNRSSWTLVGLAVRIAHGLGLHRDGKGLAYSAFEAEMRRRLWWELVVLDMKASEDRGSEPMITEHSFNTRMPCNLNDEDFGHDSQHPLPERKGVSGMTFSLISMDVSNTARKVNFVPPDAEHRPLTLRQKEELVKQCSERIESHHLAGCDLSDPHHWMLYMLGRLLILKLWSVIQYPLQSRQTEDLPRGQSLRTVVSMLEVTEMMQAHESAARFNWYFETYVPWHTLAVALAELCNETQGPLADRAWDIIDKCYDKYSDRVADSKDGMLWRPIKSLLKRAQAARLRTQQPDAGQPSVQPLIDPALQDLNAVQQIPTLSLDSAQNAFDMSMMGDGMGHMSQTPYPLFGDDFFSLTNMPLSNTQTFDENMNWNDWNEFVLDVHALGPFVAPNTMMDSLMQD